MNSMLLINLVAPNGVSASGAAMAGRVAGGVAVAEVAPMLSPSVEEATDGEPIRAAAVTDMDRIEGRDVDMMTVGEPVIVLGTMAIGVEIAGANQW